VIQHEAHRLSPAMYARLRLGQIHRLLPRGLVDTVHSDFRRSTIGDAMATWGPRRLD
jgi:hypothetical protein